MVIEKAVADVANHNLEIDEPIALSFGDKKIYHLLKKRGEIKVYNSVELFTKDYCSWLKLSSIEISAKEARVVFNIIRSCDNTHKENEIITFNLIKREDEWITI